MQYRIIKDLAMSLKLTLWMLAAILTCGTLATSCKHNMDDYVPPQPKPFPSDEERVAYAEKLFGVTIDKNQDWVLTCEYSVATWGLGPKVANNYFCSDFSC